MPGGRVVRSALPDPPRPPAGRGARGQVGVGVGVGGRGFQRDGLGQAEGEVLVRAVVVEQVADVDVGGGADHAVGLG